MYDSPLGHLIEDIFCVEMDSMNLVSRMSATKPWFWSSRCSKSFRQSAKTIRLCYLQILAMLRSFLDAPWSLL